MRDFARGICIGLGVLCTLLVIRHDQHDPDQRDLILILAAAVLFSIAGML